MSELKKEEKEKEKEKEQTKDDKNSHDNKDQKNNTVKENNDLTVSWTWPKLVTDEKEIASMTGPTDTSNWVIKPRLIVGAYPGDKETKKATEKLTNILNLGVDTFIVLQTDDELKKFVPYKDIAIDIKKKITKSDEDTLDFLKFPILDGWVANDMETLKFVDQVINLITCGKTIYMHCWGGHGRGGLISALLLSKIYNLKAEETLEIIDKYHATRKVHGTGHTLSRAQQHQFSRIINFLKGGSGGGSRSPGMRRAHSRSSSSGNSAVYEKPKHSSENDA